MAKKHKKRDSGPRGETIPTLPPGQDRVSVRGKKVVLCGIASIALGFLTLTRTDPRGRNWASVLSPFLILGGYGIVAAGIFVPDPEPLPPVSVPAAPVPR
jgi:hypothetical protein